MSMALHWVLGSLKWIVHTPAIMFIEILSETYQSVRRPFPLVEEKAQEFYANRQIKGARLLIVKNQTEAEEKLIWCDYPSITNGRFPFLCCLLQPFDGNPVDIDELMAELNFISCAENDPWGDE